MPPKRCSCWVQIVQSRQVGAGAGAIKLKAMRALLRSECLTLRNKFEPTSMKSPLGPSLYPSIITSIWALISLIVILSSLYLTDGRLVYTLDDAYIALKLANVVLGGGYGVNASEYSSPSSSILYPLMLVVTQRLGLASAGPLVLKLIAA